MFFGDSAKKVALQNGVKKTKEREDVLKEFFQQADSTLVFIRNMGSFEKYQKERSKQRLQYLNTKFLAFMQSQQNFMQLRYIDKTGMEIARINRDTNQSSPYIVTSDKLQNKSHRYYFQESITQKLEKSWFTKLDPNIENKMLQTPLQPTLRAIMPIKYNNEFDGILVVNYFMKDFLKKFTNTPLYDMILCDDDGYSIYHYSSNNSDNGKSWGRFLNPQYNISAEFPNYHEKILSTPLLHTENFVSKKLDIDIPCGLNLILQLKKSYLENQFNQKITEYIFVSLIVFGLSFILAYLIVKLFSEKLLNIKKLKQLNNDLVNSKEELQKTYENVKKLLNLQKNIVIVTDGKRLSFANQKFFEFFGYKDLNEFNQNHECICEYFIKNDRFFHLGKIDKDKNWVKEIQNILYNKRVVSIISKDFKPYAFSVSVSEFEKDTFIVSFTDISQTMSEYIKMEEKTIHDKLTGAFNREFFEQNIKQLILEYTANKSSLAIALFDIDHFKSVNDTHGHDVGDAVLTQFVKTINKFSRNEDILIRWGGEEFILILKVNSQEDLQKALEHLRKVVHMTEFPTVGEKTCSVGGSIYKKDEAIKNTIKRADEALYDAKAKGRNTVVIK